MNLLRKAYCRVFQFCFKVALPVLPYREPQILESMPQIAQVLSEKDLHKVLIITDKGISSLGLLDELCSALAAKNIAYTIYDDTVANPTIANVEEARQLYLDQGCQALIGFGGGSSMDCAKVVGARIVKPNQPVTKMKGLLRVLKKLPPFFAVPTTAGTGSETTLAAVITDQNTRHKYPINDFSLIPRYAVLDYKVTLGLPQHITSTTGMDALTHAVEAYIGGSTTKHTRAMAEEAVRLIRLYLKRAYDDGSDIEARSNMLRAAYCAGIAFTQSYVGYVHGVAHSLGGQYGVPHGLANAVILPYFLEEYGKSCEKRLGRLARVCEIADMGDSDRIASAKFISWVWQMNQSMNIPKHIPQIRYEDIALMASHADKESNPLYPVPKLMNAKELEKMYYIIAGDNCASKTTLDHEAAEAADKNNSSSIEELVAAQKAFFATGKTLDVDYRIAMLKKFKQAILDNESEINRALKQDLGKSETESYMCETGMTLSELSYQIKHVKRWAKNHTKATGLANFHAKSFTVQEPYGSVLIMSPWNYPFMLCLEPMAGAIAAGNCCILKPSAYSPATSAVIKKIVESVFPPEYVAVVQGGRNENTQLLEQRFDYIFFTGGTVVGRLVMEKAAANLTPVTLELGGKSPCIIDTTCDLKLAAKRVVFGKYLNCGQTCVAPDYILIDEKIRDEFIAQVKLQIEKMFGQNPLQNPDYGKIINQKHFDRLCGLMSRDKVVLGGQTNPDTLQIAPTVMSGVTADDPIMQEEIFGPIMPILTYKTLDEAESFVKNREKPLALYIFTKDRAVEQRFLSHVSFGGGCVNDTILHLASSTMGFGGVGNSGMGSYHGKKSFDTFSHEKSILKKYCWIDMPMRYQPFNQINDKLIRMFLR